MRWPRSAAGLGALSAACMLTFTATAVEIPADFAIPLVDFAGPQLLDGRVSVNPQSLDALLPPQAYGSGAGPENDASFNLGELIFARGPSSLLPVLATWAASGALLWRLHRRRGSDERL
jgi:hypothetical protein